MFENRKDAGEQIAELLKKYKNAKDTIVLGIPRGGVEVGYYIAKELNLPLSIVVIKKLGHPANKEYAIGAVGKNAEYINEEIIKTEFIDADYIKKEIIRLRDEVNQRYKKYAGEKIPDIKNKTIILCDDGIATGMTIMLSVEILKKQKPKKIIIAVAVAPDTVIGQLKKIADEIYCPMVFSAAGFFAIGQFYKNFEQVEDDYAIKLFNKLRKMLN